MFGLGTKDQNTDETLTAHPTVVSQSNATLPSLPDSGSFPSPSTQNKLPHVSTSAMSAPVLAEPMINPPSNATSPQAMPLNEIGMPEPLHLETTKTPAPTINLSNAYIATDPPHVAASTNKPEAPPKPTAASLLTPTSEDELLKMKQKALQSLAPLVDHLDQPPEEKFKTTMMLLQASDNAELVKDAFDAANLIKEDKVRAQALLDVVNEINYFTQHGVHSQDPVLN
jgi:hypothetical protein